MKTITQTNTVIILCPTDLDVICGSGKAASAHPGNKRFRAILSKHLGEYKSAWSKKERMQVTRNIFDDIMSSGRTRFLKKDPIFARFYVVGTRAARDKITHSLRDSKVSKNRRARMNTCQRSTHNESINILAVSALKGMRFFDSAPQPALSQASQHSASSLFHPPPIQESSDGFHHPVPYLVVEGDSMQQNSTPSVAPMQHEHANQLNLLALDASIFEVTSLITAAPCVSLAEPTFDARKITSAEFSDIDIVTADKTDSLQYKRQQHFEKTQEMTLQPYHQRLLNDGGRLSQQSNTVFRPQLGVSNLDAAQITKDSADVHFPKWCEGFEELEPLDDLFEDEHRDTTSTCMPFRSACSDTAQALLPSQDCFDFLQDYSLAAHQQQADVQKRASDQIMYVEENDELQTLVAI